MDIFWNYTIDRDLQGRHHAGAYADGHQHGVQKPSTETSVTEFCYKSMNISLEEIKKTLK